MRHICTAIAITALAGVPALVSAQDAATSTEGTVSFSASGDGAELYSTSSAAGSDDEPMRRYRPLPMALELGVYYGIAFPAKLDLQDDDLTGKSKSDPYRRQGLSTAADLGAHLAFYPLSWLGLEAEGGVMPSRTQKDQAQARLYTVRGHAILQLPTYRLVPFALVGAGTTGIKSRSMGKDSELSFHLGAGLKAAVSQCISVRLEARNSLMNGYKKKVGELSEILFGLSYTWGRTPWIKHVPEPDTDGDGVKDSSDQCPDVAGVPPLGCPPVLDTDADGIEDARDACPSEPEDGGAPSAADGCPDRDRDRDGIAEPEDQCPAEAGIAPTGCPDKDTDGDGLLDSKDSCADRPETVNGFEDKDGCPDELPQEVAKFSGVVKGIQFDSGKATIRPGSNALLDEAAGVMTQYPELRVLITGHTDNKGIAEKNVALSLARADAVKAYLVGKGIDTARIETRGAGPDEPIADNATAEGRAENRRIQFILK